MIRPILVAGLILIALGNLHAKQFRATDAGTTPSVKIRGTDYRAAFDDFDAQLNRWRETKEADNSHGGLAWRESYLMLAYMRMYRATGELEYLRKLTHRFDQILPLRDDKLGRIDDYTSTALAGWGSQGYDRNAKWHVWLVHTGMITMAPAEFLREVHRDPKLAHEFGTSAGLYRATIVESLGSTDQYWRESADGREGWFVDPGIGLLPLNQSNAVGSTLLVMHDVTSNTEYLRRAELLARFFKNRIRREGDHYEWAYWPKEKGPITGGEDISHAAINVDFAVRCAQKGVVFAREDLQRMAHTWLNSVRRPDGTWAGHVDGTGTSEKYMPGSAGRWLILCELLKGRLRDDLLKDVARAYHVDRIQMPSHALGLANLELYLSTE